MCQVHSPDIAVIVEVSAREVQKHRNTSEEKCSARAPNFQCHDKVIKIQSCCCRFFFFTFSRSSWRDGRKRSRVLVLIPGQSVRLFRCEITQVRNIARSSRVLKRVRLAPRDSVSRFGYERYNGVARLDRLAFP